MARWKLMVAHYLNVEGTKWEYKEVSRTTGKEVRVQPTVPLYLDPRDHNDFTHKWGQQAHPGVHSDIEGEIIVSRGPSVDPKDIVFVGDPTPDMVPLDDEAKAISATFAERWRYKPEAAPGNYSQSLVDQFQIAMADSSTKSAKVEGLDELVLAIKEMAKVNQEIIRNQVRSLR